MSYVYTSIIWSGRYIYIQPYILSLHLRGVFDHPWVTFFFRFFGFLCKKHLLGEFFMLFSSKTLLFLCFWVKTGVIPPKTGSLQTNRACRPPRAKSFAENTSGSNSPPNMPCSHLIIAIYYLLHCCVREQ